MRFQDAFENQTITDTGVSLTTDEAEELEEFLESFINDYFDQGRSQDEGEIDYVTLGVMAAGLAFQAGRAYQSQLDNGVQVTMDAQTVQQFINYLIERAS